MKAKPVLCCLRRRCLSTLAVRWALAAIALAAAASCWPAGGGHSIIAFCGDAVFAAEAEQQQQQQDHNHPQPQRLQQQRQQQHELPREKSEPREVGELTIPLASPLNAAALDRLRRLVRTDEHARRWAEQMRDEAEPLLDRAPDPLVEIHYEGLVNTDPRRLAAVAKLRQMAHAAVLMRHWQASSDRRAAAALKRLIIAWAGAYRPTGNDVNENKLYPLLAAYASLRSEMPDEDRGRVDAWVEQFGRLHAQAVERSQLFTNRYAKHVRLLFVCGRILDRPKWEEQAIEGARRFAARGLRADGTSEDLHRRDTLTYHCSALTPVLELAMLAGPAGRELYEWTAPEGGSIRKSVEYVIPYAAGEKTREEWKNSTVGLDRRRAEAGLEHYRPGRLFKPVEALELMELAEFFDPKLLPLVQKLSGRTGDRFPTWQTLVNRALDERPAGDREAGPRSANDR